MDSQKDKEYKRWRDGNRQDAQSEAIRIFPNYRRKEPTLASILDEVAKSGITGIPAEDALFANVRGIKTTKLLDYEPHKVPAYALTDKEAEFVTSYLECIPSEADNCFSILKYVKSREDQGLLAEFTEKVLGFTKNELQDFVIWMNDPTRRIGL